MSKFDIYLFILIILSILFLIKSQEATNQKQEEENDNDDDEDEDNEPDDDSEKYFKESLKEYLVEHKLFESEKLIQPEEMKKIFLEVVTEGDAEASSSYFGGLFIELADYFVNEYYRNMTQIRGKDIYDLINMDQISKKFEELMNDNSKYNGADDNNYENNDDYDNDYDNDYDYDYRDDIGDPILDH